jgi:hypothetical protein
MEEGARAVYGSQMSSRCHVWISIHGRNRECGVNVQLSKDPANLSNVRSRPRKSGSAFHQEYPLNDSTVRFALGSRQLLLKKWLESLTF